MGTVKYQTSKMGRRGPKKHLKTLAAPHHWMLPKTGGVHAFRPNAGPHKLRERLPLAIIIRNRLKYALNAVEAKKIMMARNIKVDGKVRTDVKFPAGFMDVITIDKSGENFRLIYDTKGRFVVHRINADEASYKLCRVKSVNVGKNSVPFLVTNDGRTIRYPNPGSFDIVHVKDAAGHSFSTRMSNIFIIGKGNKSMVSLPKDKGIRKTIAEERDARIAARMN